LFGKKHYLCQKLKTKTSKDMIAGIICGILAGFIACKLTNKEGKGCIVDLFLGIIGGAVGGFVFDLLGIQTNNTIGEIVCAVIGAVIVLWACNKLFK
jgi:uncharacterized membrane protein YeaQ/YmgE (transglycosylase-associated protein family)